LILIFRIVPRLIRGGPNPTFDTTDCRPDIEYLPISEKALDPICQSPRFAALVRRASLDEGIPAPR